jgi:LppM domain
MRSTIRIIAVATLALVCTSCLKVDLAMRLHTDDTVDGTMTYAVSKDLLTLTHSSPDALLDQVASGQPLPSGIDYQTTDYADDAFVGKTHTFDGADIASFPQEGFGGETLSIRRVGDSFQVSGEVDLTTSSTGPLQPGAAQLARDMQLRLAITFPGPVQDQSGGTITGPNTVTWTPTYGKKTEITATGSALGDRTSDPILWIVLAAAVVALAVLVVAIVRRREHVPAPAETEARSAGTG